MNLKIGKKSIVTALLILVGLAVYNVLFFVIPFNFEHSAPAFWLTYGFTTFFLLFAAVIAFLGLRNKKITYRVFGIPLLKLAVASIIFQLIVDILVMSLGSFFTFPAWIVGVVDTLAVAYVIIALIVYVTFKDHIETIDSYAKKEQYTKELRIELEVLKNKYSSCELAKELNGLYETVLYTDPVSSEEVAEVENEILSKLDDLRKQLEENNLDEARKSIDTLNNLIAERKTRLKSVR